ncbi:hypothetical protein IQ251_15235 [Saccharopolyspora sp. HNM0983]|uniref:Subtilisin inhibitor domain-containing protein n=2 Tax=Saccharopolyspora montiporae TaxID=2781240 RepID=A0A929G2H6_9PSEU|nr:hypothetical protein [Saccharopolyspora sp. HNM0983]
MPLPSQLSATALAAAALVGGAALAGGAAPAAADPVPASTVQLTIQGENLLEASVTTLNCEPSGGTHPAADTACDALITADGDFAALPVEPRACTLQYDPVTVHASGTWHGEPIHFQQDYPNRCAAASESGGVFDF